MEGVIERVGYPTLFFYWYSEFREFKESRDDRENREDRDKYH